MCVDCEHREPPKAAELTRARSLHYFEQHVDIWIGCKKLFSKKVFYPVIIGVKTYSSSKEVFCMPNAVGSSVSGGLPHAALGGVANVHNEPLTVKHVARRD